MLHKPAVSLNSRMILSSQDPAIQQRCQQLVILVAVVLCTCAQPAKAQPEVARPWSDISRLAREAADAPGRGADGSLETDRSAILVDLERVDNVLLRNTQFGKGWRSFLHIEQIRQLAQAQDAVDQPQLDACCRRMRSALVVWSHPTLKSLKASLDRYARDARILLDNDYDGNRTTCLRQLADRLDQLDSSPSPEDLRQLAELGGWLMQRGEATAVANALETVFLKPDFIVQLSNSALDSELRTPINEDFAVNATYVDTPVQGQANIQGMVKPQLSTVGSRAAIDLLLDAETIARTSGINSGVAVSTTGRASIRGIKRILIEPTGLQPLAAAANATAAVYFTNVNAGGGRYGAQASSQVYGSRARAENETAAEAKNGAQARLDQMAQIQIDKINEPFRKNVLYPLVTRDAWPRSFKTVVKDGQLQVAAVNAGWNEFGPFDAPPGLDRSLDASLQVHVSGIERTARDMLAGRTVRGQEFGDLLSTASSPSNATTEDTEPSADAPSKPSHAAREKSADWWLIFDAQQPLSVEIDQGLVQIVMRLSEFHSEGKDFPAMKVKLAYRATLDGEVVRFVREGTLNVTPLDFVSNAGQRLTGPQHVMCKILSRRMQGVLATEYELRSLFSDQAFSRLKLSDLDANHGWLSIGMTLKSDTLTSTP